MSLKRWKKTGRTLGEGGQAQVFVVTDRDDEFDGELALKVLKNRERTDRIDLEISTTKSLARSDCAVVPILDDYTKYTDDSAKPWYVMPKADGGNLDDRITRGQAYGGSEEAALTTFGEIAAAVHSLHQNGVAHRDIKPANILIDAGQIWKP